MDSCYPTEEPEKLWINRVGIQTVWNGKVVIEEGEIWRRRKRGRGDECGFRLAELIKGSIYHKRNSEEKDSNLKVVRYEILLHKFYRFQQQADSESMNRKWTQWSVYLHPNFMVTLCVPPLNLTPLRLPASRNPTAVLINGQTAISNSNTHKNGGGTVVKVLCHKSEGRWFDPTWCHWNFWHKILPIALWPWGRLSL